MARASLDQHARDLSPEQTTNLCDWPRSRIQALDVELGRLPQEGMARINERNSKFKFRPGPYQHWAAWAFTLAFAYHKLMPICGKEHTVDLRSNTVVKTKPNWKCTAYDMSGSTWGGDRAAGDFDGQTVYDLLPLDPEAGYCHGEGCARATLALDRLRSLLHVITPFRTALIQGFVQWKCPYDDGGAFVSLFRRLNRELPGVIASLKAVREGIVAACVAPERMLSIH